MSRAVADAGTIARLRPGRGQTRHQQARTWSLLFVAPAGALLLLLIAYPLVQVVRDSVWNVNLVDPTVHGFAGLDNFTTIFTDDAFWPSVWRTVEWTVLSVTGEYVFGLSSALALARTVPGVSAFRALVIVPWVVPIVVAGLAWTWMLSPDFGVINAWLIDAGVIRQPINWLGRLGLALPTIAIVNIWRSFPFYTISFLAALQAIPADVREAAALDGAGPIARFRHITLPYLKPVTITLVLLHVIWTAINFDFIWVMTEGGPLNASETLPIMIYRYGMQDFDVGAASALATIILGMLVSGFFLVHYARRRA